MFAPDARQAIAKRADAEVRHRAPSPDETSQLLGGWHAGDRLPFSENRLLCLGYTERAMALLDDFASLEIEILQARNLHALSLSNSLEDPGSPYVIALLDDSEVFRTEASARPSRTDPKWTFKGSIPFLSPQSMVRLQVKDRDTMSHEEDIGFVEFCLGSLPWDRPVEGWLELRLQDKLEWTSWWRYRRHRCIADRASDQTSLRKAGASLGMKCFACGVGTAPIEKNCLDNAGDLLVRLQLKLRGGCSRLDRLFALALDCPYPEDVGRNLYQRHHSLPGYKIEDLGDNLADLRHNVLDNSVLSFVYFVVYVLQWRSPLLSVMVLASLVGMWYNFSYGSVLIPGVILVFFVLFACESWRHDMTTGGMNAPLTQQGFERVARWRSTPAMTRFLRRVVEDDLQGKVADEKKFRACAGNCFVSGRPRVSFTELRNYMESAEFTSNCSSGGGLAVGSRVMARGRRAVVMRIFDGNPQRVNVQYEDTRDHSTDTVNRDDVRLRPRLPRVPEWILGTSLGLHVRNAQSVTGQVSRSLNAIFGAISNVLAWRWPLMSLSVALLLLAIAAGNLFLFFIKRDGHRGCKSAVECFPVTEGVFMFFAAVRGYASLVFWVILFLWFSRWFSGIRNVLKMLFRFMFMRRNAPSCWAFYSEGSPPPPSNHRHKGNL